MKTIKCFCEYLCICVPLQPLRDNIGSCQKELSLTLLDNITNQLMIVMKSTSNSICGNYIIEICNLLTFRNCKFVVKERSTTRP